MIRKVTTEDAPQIAEIYNYYILNSTSTFEILPISIEEVIERINNVSSSYPWIVYEKDGRILGYAYATSWKPRAAYKNTVESTVYVKPGEFAKGIGTKLYTELINHLAFINIHAVLGGISLPNDASIHLHEKLGFKKVGQLNEVGFKFDRWIDVGYWELVLGKK